MNRCRRYPGIKEDFLNDTVWNAVKSWLEKPEVINSGVNSVAQSNQREIESSIEHDTRALEQIRAEETRIVQAYRLGVLTSEQLGDELKGLQARRALVNQSELKKTVKVGIETVHRSLEDYRQHISERLEMLSKEQRREILQHLVVRIIFEGERVRIIGRVAVSSDSTTARTSALADAPTLETIEDTSAIADLPKSNIAGTTSWDHAHNADDRIAGTTSWDYTPLSRGEDCRKSKFSHLYLSEPGEYPEAHAAQRRGYPRIYKYLAERFSRTNLGRRGPKVRTGGYGTLRAACQTERRVRSVAGSRKPER